jgi:hypothetical protein
MLSLRVAPRAHPMRAEPVRPACGAPRPLLRRAAAAPAKPSKVQAQPAGRDGFTQPSWWLAAAAAAGVLAVGTARVAVSTARSAAVHLERQA